MTDINWTLINNLATKPHKHLNISKDCEFTCTTHGDDHWIGEVEQEARTVQHLCDLAGVPEGEGYAAHADARVFLLLAEVLALREQLSRIGAGIPARPPTVAWSATSAPNAAPAGRATRHGWPTGPTSTNPREQCRDQRRLLSG